MSAIRGKAALHMSAFDPKRTLDRSREQFCSDRFLWFLFQEGNLGSLAPGKYADLLVLDRDYLTVPEDEIKDIKPVLTMVGGKIVYDANVK